MSRMLDGAEEKRQEEHIDRLCPIKTIEPEGLNVVSADGRWEEIELAVDSGATEPFPTHCRRP